MFHEPAEKSQVTDLAMAYKTRLGVWMFLVYALVYVLFVAINLIDPSMMEKTVLMGLNLAVVYGLGLIVVALVMAVIYNRMCLVEERRLEAPASDKAGV
jgi:uncharacterized membrane protein (DUF485 family)